MVCVACFVVPALLWVYRQFLHPLLVHFWDPEPWVNWLLGQKPADQRKIEVYRDSDEEESSGPCAVNGSVINSHSMEKEKSDASQVHAKED